jgi:hypothetical protein
MKQYAHLGLAGCVTRFRSRTTKTLVGVYHGAQAGMEDDPELPWISVCEEHHTIVGHATLGQARLTRDPTEFCDNCRSAQLQFRPVACTPRPCEE